MSARRARDADHVALGVGEVPDGEFPRRWLRARQARPAKALGRAERGFAQDATFCPQPGNSGEGHSFESLNDPSMFIRHFDYIVFIARLVQLIDRPPGPTVSQTHAERSAPLAGT